MIQPIICCAAVLYLLMGWWFDDLLRRCGQSLSWWQNLAIIIFWLPGIVLLGIVYFFLLSTSLGWVLWLSGQQPFRAFTRAAAALVKGFQIALRLLILIVFFPLLAVYFTVQFWEKPYWLSVMAGILWPASLLFFVATHLKLRKQHAEMERKTAGQTAPASQTAP